MIPTRMDPRLGYERYSLLRSVSLELFESWRPGGHWLAGELIQGLATGTSYREVSLPRRAEEIAFHQRWWERGFESSVVVPDEGFVAVVGGLGWFLEVNKLEMAVTEGGLTKELVQRKVTLEGGGSVVVTVMILHLVDDSPDLFRFRFAPRRRDQPADGEPSLFNSFVLKKLSHSSDVSESEVEWQDFSADHPHFSEALWMYLASEAVSANGWFVEGFPRRLEINRGQAIDANPEDYAEFVRGASELAVAIMTDGRVTSAVGSPSSVAASGGGASVIGGRLCRRPVSFRRVRRRFSLRVLLLG